MAHLKRLNLQNNKLRNLDRIIFKRESNTQTPEVDSKKKKQ